MNLPTATTSLILLMKWGDYHCPPWSVRPDSTFHAGCGGTIGPDFRCDRCGKRAGVGEIELPPGPGVPRAGHAGL